jgi:hypothetical protein
LINAKTISDFNEADLVLNEHLKEHQRVDQFIPYYTEHVRPLLQSQLSTGLRIGFSSGNWTNNNAESKNAIIKYIASTFLTGKIINTTKASIGGGICC